MSSNRQLFIEFTTTDQCNCQCKYCFEHKDQYCKKERNLKEEERQLALLEHTCEQLSKDNSCEWLTVAFWGGEPFLNLDFIIKLIEVSCKYSFVRYHVYSNGTLTQQFEKLVNQSFFDNIKDRFHVQLSYDGEPHHTFMRGDNSEAIFRTADLLKEHGVYFYFKATLSFNMLDKLPEIWKSYEKLYEKYGKNATYSPTLDTTYRSDDKLQIWTEALQKVLLLECTFIKRHHTVLWDWFNPNACRKANCMLGSSIHVHNDGSIFICHGCAYVDNNEKLKLGSTSGISSFLEVLSDKYHFDQLPPDCTSCQATYCQACHIEQLDKTKDPYSQWISCRSNNFNRCKYYKVFGFFAKLLKMSIIFAIHKDF